MTLVCWKRLSKHLIKLLRLSQMTKSYELIFLLVCNGRLEEGLDEYEWRWKTKNFYPEQRKFNQPMWDGKK